MNTNAKNSSARFWIWIVVALIFGAVVGFVAGAGTIIVLEALIS